MFSINRNSYLQCQASIVNFRIINRSVDLARREAILKDHSYCELPVFRLTSEQPLIPITELDPTRRPLAFGKWALPKLRRELLNKDDVVVIHALLTLCDLIRDPENAFEALRLKIPNRLSEKLDDSIVQIREVAALAIQIIAEYEEGRLAIVANYNLLDNLILGLGDEVASVRLKVAACFEMLARSWMIADVLVDKELVNTILEIVERGEVLEILEFHLDTLKSLMHDCGKCIAIKENGFRIFVKLLNNSNSSIVTRALDCLAILTSTKKGKKLATNRNLLKTLTRLIHYEDMEIVISATSLIMFCTIKTRSKQLAAEIKSLPKRLIKLAVNPLSANLQMLALKALTNICEDPDVRKEVRENFIKDLNNLQVPESNIEYKKTLMRLITWQPENFV